MILLTYWRNKKRMKASIEIKFPNEELARKYLNKDLAITLFGKEGMVKIPGVMKPLEETEEERINNNVNKK